jgi:hypothetical protein
MPLGEMEIQTRDKIQNLDIVDLVNRVDRFMNEVSRAASATRTETSTHDIARQHSILTRLESRFKMYGQEPELDLPHYHPKPMSVPAAPSILNVENNDSQQLLNLLSALRTELLFSDSAERSTSFNPADKCRIQAVIDKARQLIVAVEEDPFIDTPDVNHQQPPVNSGVPN